MISFSGSVVLTIGASISRSRSRYFPVILLLFPVISPLFSTDLSILRAFLAHFSFCPPPFTGIYRDAPGAHPSGVHPLAETTSCEMPANLEAMMAADMNGFMDTLY